MREAAVEANSSPITTTFAPTQIEGARPEFLISPRLKFAEHLRTGSP
jgi:hypothetical protein